MKAPIRPARSRQTTAGRSFLILPTVVAVTMIMALVLVLVLHSGAGGTRSSSTTDNGGSGQASQTTATLSAGTDMQGRQAPAFTLSDQYGNPIALTSLRGHPVVLAFLDATCTEQCPILVQYLNWTTQFLTPQQVSQIAWVAISVNPNNTQAQATAFLLKNNAAIRVHFLLGTQAQLQPLWKAYYIQVQPGQTDVAHTSGLYLIDQQGREREWVDEGFDPKALAKDLATLLKR